MFFFPFSISCPNTTAPFVLRFFSRAFFDVLLFFLLRIHLTIYYVWIVYSLSTIISRSWNKRERTNVERNERPRSGFAFHTELLINTFSFIPSHSFQSFVHPLSLPSFSFKPTLSLSLSNSHTLSLSPSLSYNLSRFLVNKLIVLNNLSTGEAPTCRVSCASLPFYLFFFLSIRKMDLRIEYRLFVEKEVMDVKTTRK